MGGRPRDDDVKDEPDEDEAAMLGEGSSRGYSHRKQQSAGLGEAGGEAIMALATQEEKRLAARPGLRELSRAEDGGERAAGSRHALAVRAGEGDAGSLRTPGIERTEEEFGG